MDEDLKKLIATFYDLADAMKEQGYTGSGQELKVNMVLVSVAIAAAEGGITATEIKCVNDYLDYPLTSEMVHDTILPTKLENILTEPPGELFSFVAAEGLECENSTPGYGVTSEMFIQTVDVYLTKMIEADGFVDENEIWIKDKYIDMLKANVAKTRKIYEMSKK